MAAKRYFVISGGEEEKGPYTLKQLREAVEQLAIADSVEVRAEGREGTRRLSDLLREKKRRAAPDDVYAPPAEDEVDRFKQEMGGNYGLGLAIGLVAGCFALPFSSFAKPQTRKGIVTGFLIGLAIGIVRLMAALASR